MKMRNSICGIALLCFAFASCTNEQDTNGEHPAEGMTSVQFTFSSSSMDVATRTFTVPTFGEEIDLDVSLGGDEEETNQSEEMATRATRAGEVPDDRKISNICVFQFADSKLIYSQYVTTFSEKDGAKTAESLLIMNDKSNEIYVVANLGDVTSKFSTAAGKETVLSAFEKWAFDPTIVQGATGAPMAGVSTLDLVQAVNLPIELPVTLNPTVACVRFTGANKVPVGKGTFKFEEVTLCNVTTETPLVAPATSAAPTTVRDLVPIAYTEGDTQVWYVPENKSGSVPELSDWWERGYEKAPLKAMYVEIKGKFTPAGSSDWLEVHYQIFLGSGVTDFNVERGHRYIVNAGVTDISTSDKRVIIGEDLGDGGREAANCYVTLKADHEYCFKASVQGNGKTVLLTPTAGVVGNSAIPRTMIPTKALLIWQTAGTEGVAATANVIDAASVSLKGGYVCFKTLAGATEGNAVIGVQEAGNAANEVAWSWHIWVTKTDPNDPANMDTYNIRNNITGKFVSSGGWNARSETVMNRNLGAANNTPGHPLCVGLFYEWGRKDPFASPANYTMVESTTPAATVVHNTNFAWRDGSPHGAAVVAVGEGAAAVAYAAKHPTWFCMNKNNTTLDWVAGARANQDDNLWGNPNATPDPSASQLPNQSRGSKSMYDPCPYGWRVPPQDIFTAFTTTGNNVSNNSSLFNIFGNFNAGLRFYCQSNKSGNTAYFPVSGYRTGTSGNPTNVGQNGYSWHASTCGSASMSATFLTFNAANIFSYNNGYRAYGFPVRCVRE